MIGRLLWRGLALVFVGLALIGIALPGMPTTVFLLLAAWAAGRGWPRLNRWLLQHPRLGPPIHHWREHRAVPRRAKCLAALSMTLSMLLICLSALPLWCKWLLPLLIAAVLCWLLTRQEGPEPRSGLR